MTNAANLSIVIDAINSTNKTLQQIKSDLQGLDAPAKQAGTSLGGIKTLLAAGFASEGFAKVTGFIKESVAAAAEDEASQARLKTAIDNTGAGYAAYGAQVQQAIKRGQELGFTDDQTRSALSILTAQTNDAGEALKRYGIAQDLARGADIDVVIASRLLGKVTDENVTALNRYGIAVHKGASETELFAAIQQKFSGQAQAYADTTAGQFDQLKDKVHELQEDLGRIAFPPLKVTVSGLDKLLDQYQKVNERNSSRENPFTALIHGAEQFYGDLAKGDPSLRGFHTALTETTKASDAYAVRLRELGETEAADVAPTLKLADSLSDLEKHLTGVGGVLVAGSAEWKTQVDAEKEAIQTSAAHKEIIRAANEALGKQVDSQGNVIESLGDLVAKTGDSYNATIRDKNAKLQWAAAHNIAADSMGNILPTMSELIGKEADSYQATQRDKQAKLEFATANHLAADSMGNLLPTYSELIGRENDSYQATLRDKQAKLDFAAANHLLADSNGNLLPTMQELVAVQGDSYNATLREKEARIEFAAANHLAADSEGNLIQTTEQLVAAQEDSINASIRQSNATLQVAQNDFPHLVQQERASILASQAMQKATAEANKELVAEGLIADTTASSLDHLASSQYSVADYGTAALAPNFRPQDFQTIRGSPTVNGGGGSASGGSSGGTSGGSVGGVIDAGQTDARVYSGGQVQFLYPSLAAAGPGSARPLTSAEQHTTNNYYAPVNNNYGSSGGGGSSSAFLRI